MSEYEQIRQRAIEDVISSMEQTIRNWKAVSKSNSWTDTDVSVPNIQPQPLQRTMPVARYDFSGYGWRDRALRAEAAEKELQEWKRKQLQTFIIKVLREQAALLDANARVFPTAFLESEQFYELCQRYRNAHLWAQAEVTAAFETLKRYIRGQISGKPEIPPKPEAEQ